MRRDEDGQVQTPAAKKTRLMQHRLIGNNHWERQRFFGRKMLTEFPFLLRRHCWRCARREIMTRNYGCKHHTALCRDCFDAARVTCPVCNIQLSGAQATKHAHTCELSKRDFLLLFLREESNGQCEHDVGGVPGNLFPDCAVL